MEAGEKTTGENGRVIQISAAVRLCDLSPSTTPASLLKMMEDMEEPPTPTPLGFQVVSSAQADSPLLPEGEWESGSGSDGPPLWGRAPPATWMDFLLDKRRTPPLPPANQRVEEGQAKFQDLLLAPPLTDCIPYLLMDELEKRYVKKLSNKAPTDRQDKNSESRSSRSVLLAMQRKAPWTAGV
ncbi:hypothetical protein J4Q44_G00217960 [Coregonus suidteri]|uniref:Uncharacterized protein n=1 Tax=Coregonus suidteri TaxID=861788 RepID=A0AAN8QM36_9TELE